MMHTVLSTPPVADLTRYKLKQVAEWIRDDLDILVAREGPNVLHPDDVLTLHELFVAMRQPTTITALDLRASGIHRAVKEIAGLATRWPGKLCNDCDKIIAIWTYQFGPLDDLHPFLYGRGGRLEGIASVNEDTQEALLERWARSCPKKILPEVFHKHGDLKFKAGDWWINSLFAHHAGIIGLESVDGGTTFDKNGAYALVLKDTSEIDAQSAEVFTYRCPQRDKGKFKLTAATPASREPIRVLRSHSVNSIWGPKAGIRYEGLYSVTGWRVRQAKPTDTITGDRKQGDILYEVTMQRKDRVSMNDVSRRPTHRELDDYVEYKRLRKLHRENEHTAPDLLAKPHRVVKTAPPIASPPLSILDSPLTASTLTSLSILRPSSSATRKLTFKEPAFRGPRNQDYFSTLSERDTLSIPAARGQEPGLTPGSGSIASSMHIGVKNLKEVIPWIDTEMDLSVPSLSDAPPVTRDQMISHTLGNLGIKAAEMNPVKNVRTLARDPRPQNDVIRRSEGAAEKSMVTSAFNLRLYPATRIFETDKAKSRETEKEKQARKTTFIKQKPKLFDGEGYGDDKGGDDEDVRPRLDARHIRSLSADTPRLYSPTPVRPLRPDSLLAMDCGLKFSHGIEHIEFTSPLDDLISQPRTATPVSSGASPSMISRVDSRASEQSAVGRLRRMMTK